MHCNIQIQGEAGTRPRICRPACHVLPLFHILSIYIFSVQTHICNPWIHLSPATTYFMMYTLHIIQAHLLPSHSLHPAPLFLFPCVYNCAKHTEKTYAPNHSGYDIIPTDRDARVTYGTQEKRKRDIRAADKLRK